MERHIQYDRETRDYAAYVGDVLIGFFSTYHSAEIACDEYIHDLLAHGVAA